MPLSNEVHKTIHMIANEHSSKPFAYLDKDDLYQEIWIICLTALDDYNENSGKLEHFLRVAVKTRLINKFKQLTKSIRKPCLNCEFFSLSAVGECKAFGENKENECEKYRKYSLSVLSRNALLNSTEQLEEDVSYSVLPDKVSGGELRDKIRPYIHTNFITDFNEYNAGAKLPKSRIKKLVRHIKEIVEQHNMIIEE